MLGNVCGGGRLKLLVYAWAASGGAGLEAKPGWTADCWAVVYGGCC